MGFIDFLYEIGILDKQLRKRPRRVKYAEQKGIAIQRKIRPLWEQTGWRKKDSELHGQFHTRYGSFRGIVTGAFSKQPGYLVYNLPKEVLRGPHGACFREISKGLFSVHFWKQPKDLDGGIKAVEKTIEESLKCYKTFSIQSKVLQDLGEKLSWKQSK